MTEVAQRRVRVRLVMHGDYATEVRCDCCKALLFKARMPLVKSEATGAVQNLGIEVKCRRCGRLNRF